MDYGRHLISKVVKAKSIAEVSRLGIREDHFVEPDDREVFAYITAHHRGYGKAPTLKALRADFPEYRFVESEESLEFLVDKVLHAHKGATISTLLGAAVEFYDDGDFEACETFLNAGLRDLGNRTVTGLKPLDVEALLVHWNTWRENPPEGVPYGLEPLDEETHGMQEDDFVVLVGPPGSGKSTLLLNFAMSACRKGNKIVFVTIEMSDSHHMLRVAANVTGIPMKKIKWGPLSQKESDYVAQKIRDIDDDGRWVIQQIDSSRANIAAIEALIEQHQPDAVYIDGAYLMDLPGVRRDAPQWERLSALTREIRALVLRKSTPIAISTQVLESKMQGGNVTASSVGYSSSFHQDASVMLGIQPDAEMPERQLIKVLKMRDAPKMTLHLEWDWQTYRYELIGGPADGENSEY